MRPQQQQQQQPARRNPFQTPPRARAPPARRQSLSGGGLARSYSSSSLRGTAGRARRGSLGGAEAAFAQRPPPSPSGRHDPGNIFNRSYRGAPPAAASAPRPMRARSASYSTLPRGFYAPPPPSAFERPPPVFEQRLVIELPPEYADGLPDAPPPPPPPPQPQPHRRRPSLADMPSLYADPSAGGGGGGGGDDAASDAGSAVTEASSASSSGGGGGSSLERQVRAIAHLAPGQQVGVLCREVMKLREELRRRDMELLQWNSLLRGDGSAYSVIEACAEGRLPLMRFLAERGGSPEHPDEHGRTGLMVAAQGGHLEAVRWLLERLGDSGPDSLGRGEAAASGPRVTALMCACAAGHAGVAELLLERGAAVNASSAAGLTPLAAAAGGGHVPVLDLLLAHGAERDLVDTAADPATAGTALLVALRQGQEAAAAHLIVRGARLLHESDGLAQRFEDSELALACAAGLDGIVRQLLTRGAVNVPAGPRARAPLHACAESGRAAALATLLDGGAVVDKRDAQGWTPLMVAAHAGHADCVWQLLMRGADPGHVADDGGTPLAAALVGPDGGEADAVRYLVQFGANPNAPNPMNPAAPLMSLGTDEQGRAALDGVAYRQRLSGAILAALDGLAPRAACLVVRQYLPGPPLPPRVTVAGLEHLAPPAPAPVAPAPSSEVAAAAVAAAAAISGGRP